MNFSINKSKLTALLVMVLLITSAFVLISNNLVLAQDEEVPVSGPLPSGATPSVTIDTTAHLSFRPNPVGVNQIFLVNLWTSPATHASRYHPDYKVTITKPSGDQQEVFIDSYKADATAWFEWIADEVGEWTLRFDFLGTYFPGADVSGGFFEPAVVTLGSAYYNPSTSGDLTLVVQEDIVYSWPEPGITDDYWTRPVQVEHRDWWPSLGNWPETGYVGYDDPNWDTVYPNTAKVWSPGQKFTPWVEGPDSAHIVWKRQEAIAGMIGGQAKQFGNSAGGGLGSGGIPSPDIIYAGRAYDTYTKAGTGGEQYWRCYDIRTGELYWEYQTPLVAVAGWFGMTSYSPLAPDTIEYTTTDPSQGEATGTFSVSLIKIAGGRLYKFDPWSGSITLNASIAPLSSGTYYQNAYNRETMPCVLTVQNIGNQTNPEYRLINWTTAGTSTDFSSRVLSNTSYAMSSLPSLIDFEAGLGASVSGTSTSGAYTGMILTGYDLYTGETLWTTTNDEPQYSMICNLVDHGKLAVLSSNGYYVAYDLLTGNFAWQSETMDYPWASAGFGAYSTMSAYGMIFRESMDGVYAFNWDNGTIAWKYEAPAKSVYESPYTGATGNTVYPFYSFGVGGLVADGKFFTWNYEHTENWPVTRGWSIHAIDCLTGEGVWDMMGCMTPTAIADGYLVATNLYDGYAYCIGKGLSETTVTGPDVAVPKGTGMVIKGTVLDLSPAQPGTPCVSADSMDTQMEYLHMQMPIGGLWGDEIITGVPVTLTAISESGTYIDLGTVTSNGYYGTFSYVWAPENEGTYEIIASFAGDVSYGSSAASTTVAVGPAVTASIPIEPEQPTPETPTPNEPTPEQPTPEEPATPEEPTPEEPEPEAATEAPLISTELAIIIAVIVIAIIAAVAYLVIRKRK